MKFASLLFLVSFNERQFGITRDSVLLINCMEMLSVQVLLPIETIHLWLVLYGEKATGPQILLYFFLLILSSNLTVFTPVCLLNFGLHSIHRKAGIGIIAIRLQRRRILQNRTSICMWSIIASPSRSLRSLSMSMPGTFVCKFYEYYW